VNNANPNDPALMALMQQYGQYGRNAAGEPGPAPGAIPQQQPGGLDLSQAFQWGGQQQPGLADAVGGAPAAQAAPGGPSTQDKMLMDLYTRMGALDPEQKKITRQRAMVEQLRKGAGTPGMRDTGKLTVAANPLEFLSSIAHTGLGTYQGAQADTAEDLLGQKKREEFGKFRRGAGFGDQAP